MLKHPDGRPIPQVSAMARRRSPSFPSSLCVSWISIWIQPWDVSHSNCQHCFFPFAQTYVSSKCCTNFFTAGSTHLWIPTGHTRPCRIARGCVFGWSCCAHRPRLGHLRFFVAGIRHQTAVAYVTCQKAQRGSIGHWMDFLLRPLRCAQHGQRHMQSPSFFFTERRLSRRSVMCCVRQFNWLMPLLGVISVYMESQKLCRRLGEVKIDRQRGFLDYVKPFS